ncbi:MAG: transposase [Candidatus Bathyarchaeota archaeon]|nr:transposase [Candidatus Bathyarchaeota archaeon]
MEACEVVRLFVNKAIVPVEPKRRGNPGYGRVKALRVLVYARLQGLDNDTRLVEHLEKHLFAAKTLGLSKVPDRTTVGRWWRRYLGILEETFVNIADMLQLIEPTKAVIVDSTPLVDLYDVEARWGHTGRGKFRGFKLHAAVNQLGLPLRALVTPGNCYDGPFLPKLIEDLEADYVLADAGYCSKRNFEAIKDMGAVPGIADNPRKKGKNRKIKPGELLRKKRYVVEQFNGHIKANVLDECWVRPRGLIKKAAMVTAGLISYDAEAIRSLVAGEESLKTVSKYWA